MSLLALGLFRMLSPGNDNIAVHFFQPFIHWGQILLLLFTLQDTLKLVLHFNH